MNGTGYLFFFFRFLGTGFGAGFFVFGAVAALVVLAGLTALTALTGLAGAFVFDFAASAFSVFSGFSARSLRSSLARDGSWNMRIRSKPSKVGRYVQTSAGVTLLASHSRRATSYA